MFGPSTFGVLAAMLATASAVTEVPHSLCLAPHATRLLIEAGNAYRKAKQKLLGSANPATSPSDIAFGPTPGSRSWGGALSLYHEGLPREGGVNGCLCAVCCVLCAVCCVLCAVTVCCVLCLCVGG